MVAQPGLCLNRSETKIDFWHISFCYIYIQGQGLGQMPLFNGVGPYQLQEGTGFGGSGDGLPSMWNSLDPPDSEDITEKGVSDKKKV